MLVRRSGLVACAVMLAIAAAPAQAADRGAADPEPRRGVAVDLAVISIHERLVPGQRYRLPTMRVRNPGTIDTTYAMSGRPGSDGLEAPSAWLRFTPATFTLAPDGEQVVELSLVVPPGALDGRYTGLLAAEVVGDPSEDPSTGTRVGAAAAARLDFTVVPASLLSGWWNALRRWVAAAAPWSWIAMAGSATAALLWVLSRRFHLRLERVAR